MLFQPLAKVDHCNFFSTYSSLIAQECDFMFRKSVCVEEISTFYNLVRFLVEKSFLKKCSLFTSYELTCKLDEDNSGTLYIN